VNHPFSKLAIGNKISAMVSTVPRCHAAGATISIGLILASTWVWAWGHRPVSTAMCGDEEIDLGEAKALIENADTWRKLDAINDRKQERLKARTAGISQWLPEVVEFQSMEQALLDLGEETGLHVFSIQQGKRQVGSRVAVLPMTCEIKGSYDAMCHFLHRLSTLEQPIACSEIKLQRARHESADEDLAVVDQPCRASLSLRAPYAAPDTTSWKLLKEPYHAN